MQKLKRKQNPGNNKLKRKQNTNPNIVNDQIMIAVETQQILKDIKWLEELSNMKSFSLDWCLYLLEEIALQCMGKKPVIVTDVWGKKKFKHLYRDQGALKAIEMIAKLQGHKLLDFVKLDLSVGGQVSHTHNHRVEIPQNADRTGKVIDILSRAGKFQSRLDQFDDAEVVEVHTA